MRTDELRSVLHEHSDQVVDTGAHQRLQSVRGRVRQARRRRTTGMVGVAVAAAAAMVAVVVPGVIDRDSAPSDAPGRLAGHTVPRTEVAAGYTYDYVRGVEGDADRPLRLRLPASDEPRLVMWASSAEGDASLRLSIQGLGRDLVRQAGGFDSYELLSPHSAHRLVLRQDEAAAGDRVALAVFALSDERPAGVTKGGVTYREQILDDRLLDAVIGDPGEAVVRMKVTVPEGELRVSEMCQGSDVALGTGYLVAVSAAGREVWSSSCDSRPTHDQGADGASLTTELRRRGFGPGDSVELEARLVHTDDEKTPVEGTDAVLGLGAYEESGETFLAAGWDLPERLEHEGHEWRRSFVGESEPGQGLRNVTVTASDEPLLLVTATNGLADGAGVWLVVDGEERGSRRYDAGPGAGSWGADSVLEPDRGHEITFRVRRGLTDQTELAVVLYELVR